MRDLIEALTIFLKYRDEHCPTHCEHDVMMVMDVTRDEVCEDDQQRLGELGFRWSDEDSCWASYRYGSA